MSLAVQQCLLDAVGGNILLATFPTTLLYQQLDVKPYNLDHPVTPAAVTFPETIQQIANIVSCAAEADIQVQARSGGHSYAIYGISLLLSGNPSSLDKC